MLGEEIKSQQCEWETLGWEKTFFLPLKGLSSKWLQPKWKESNRNGRRVYKCLSFFLLFLLWFICFYHYSSWHQFFCFLLFSLPNVVGMELFSVCKCPQFLTIPDLKLKSLTDQSLVQSLAIACTIWRKGFKASAQSFHVFTAWSNCFMELNIFCK